MGTACIDETNNLDINKPQGIANGATKRATTHQKRSLVILDKRALNRECFVQVLNDYGLELDLVAFESLEDWNKVKETHPPAGAVLVCVGGSQVGSGNFHEELRKIATELKDTPVIVLSDSDDLSCILQVLDCGSRGYIPTSLGMAVCAEAIRLAMVGGTFVPASAVMMNRDKFRSRTEEESPMIGLFTQRQAEVAQALRRGKANKIIAYELNLRESTVKVHIRNIMKKLKATNRTEVAFKINKLMTEENSALQ